MNEHFLCGNKKKRLKETEGDLIFIRCIGRTGSIGQNGHIRTQDWVIFQSIYSVI